ncbi:L-histidine N(alpha)-methyltransferase [Aeoliella sp.]|uniref:L-histidine N(alpha)-methyltransferase n=1 Tax=Aeoliella sp. TaxID=2795800 RepID=UPI003CCBD2E9
MLSPAPSQCPSITSREQFRSDVLAGLRAPQKVLPSKYFYDQRGSQLFDQICELPEYYLTRTEVGIMEEHAGEMGELIGPRSMLIELGSGSSMKTGWLLESTPLPLCYVPVDISGEHLLEAADRIAEQFTDIEVLPVCADFSAKFELPETETDIDRRVVYFPGSTIGNFRPEPARQLLAQIAELVGPGGGLLIGFDLAKDRQTLEAAYDDADNVTAAFNKNLLRRINQELDGDFSLDQFRHQAVYNESHSRVEMHLVSRTDQEVRIGKAQVPFSAGESIRTELSHKYRPDSFADLVQSAGFAPGQIWTDPKQLFAVGYYPTAS